MRKAFLLILLLCSINTIYAQLPTDDEGKIVFSGVVDAPGKTASELYDLAKSWAASNALDVTRDSEENTKFLGNGEFKLSYPALMQGMNSRGTVSFVFAISCKDGRYKYTFTSFAHVDQRGAKGGDLALREPACGKHHLKLNAWSKIKKDTQAMIEALLEDLANTISPPPIIVDDEDDW